MTVIFASKWYIKLVWYGNGFNNNESGMHENIKLGKMQSTKNRIMASEFT